MLSDDSSSESETGRFKSHSKTERHSKEEDSSRPPRGRELLPDLARSRNSDRSFGRNSDRRGDDRGRFDRRRSRDRYESSRRYSPVRRRYSRERSWERPTSSVRERPTGSVRERSREKITSSRDNEPRKLRDNNEKDQIETKKRSASPRNPQELKRNFREEIVKDITFSKSKCDVNKQCGSEEKKRSTKISIEGKDTEVKDKREHSRINFKSSPEDSKNKITKSLVCAPEITQQIDKSVSIEKEINRSKSRRYSTEEDISDIEEPASYYNLVPAKLETVTADDTIHSVTDSSEDEEKLRAKLLNLEKELDKSKKKKMKKSKKKSKSKHKDKDDSVEVSSTTDIQEKELEDKTNLKEQAETVEVSSTQARARKDSSEEGEICSEDENGDVKIDPTDLRHRLKKSTGTVDLAGGSPDLRGKLKAKPEVAGPALPPHLQEKLEKDPSSEIEGPQLPPHLNLKRDIGPTLPSDMRKILAESSEQTEVHFSSSEDEGIGPLPTGAEEKWTDAHKKLEERALHIKINELDGSTRKTETKSREEWMLELPEAKAKRIGLGPRQFRSKEGPDMSDRSSWTDTPQQKALKAAGVVPTEEASTTQLQSEARRRYLDERDHEHEKAVKKHKKKHKREESLLDMHQKKLKKKKKKEEKEDGSKSRRPFDRDIDLQANRFDEAQKRSIIKKAQLLDTRFSSGQAKYL